MINSSTLELFNDFDTFVEDSRELAAFEAHIQVGKIKSIMNRASATQCDTCGLQYVSMCAEFDASCPVCEANEAELKCGGDV